MIQHVLPEGAHCRAREASPGDGVDYHAAQGELEAVLSAALSLTAPSRVTSHVRCSPSHVTSHACCSPSDPPSIPAPSPPRSALDPLRPFRPALAIHLHTLRLRVRGAASRAQRLTVTLHLASIPPLRCRWLVQGGGRPTEAGTRLLMKDSTFLHVPYNEIQGTRPVVV
eukprot:1347596-Rhodomonas_salina.1